MIVRPSAFLAELLVRRPRDFPCRQAFPHAGRYDIGEWGSIDTTAGPPFRRTSHVRIAAG
jgi:hypothetical protein